MNLRTTAARCVKGVESGWHVTGVCWAHNSAPICISHSVTICISHSVTICISHSVTKKKVTRSSRVGYGISRTAEAVAMQ